MGRLEQLRGWHAGLIALISVGRGDQQNFRATAITPKQSLLMRPRCRMQNGGNPAQAAVARIQLHLGRLCMLQHRHAEARLAFKRSLAVVENTFGPENFQTAFILLNLAGTSHLLGHQTEAELLYRRAITIFQKTLGPRDVNVAFAKGSLAKMLMLQGRNTEAEALFETAIPILENSADRDERYLVSALANLAEAYRTDGRSGKAEPLYRRVLNMVSEKPALMTDEISLDLSRFPPMLRKMKRKAEARELDVQIRSLLPN